MAASIDISLNDAGYGGLSDALNDLGGGNASSASLNGPQVMLRLGNYIRDKAASGSYAGILRVSGTSAVRAVGTITLTGIPVADETITVGATVFTFKAAAAAEGEITIGADAPATVTNIVAKINAHSVASKLFLASDGAGDTVVVTCLVAGLLGNGVRFAGAASNLTMDGSGYMGATTAGAGHDSAVVLRWVGPGGGTLY